VHLGFGTPLAGSFADANEVARAIDRQILSNLKIFPTHTEAARLLGDSVGAEAVPDAAALSVFRERAAATPDELRPYLLLQYANVLRNRCAQDEPEVATAT
jgi:hypothetical protein